MASLSPLVRCVLAFSTNFCWRCRFKPNWFCSSCCYFPVMWGGWCHNTSALFGGWLTKRGQRGSGKFSTENFYVTVIRTLHLSEKGREHERCRTDCFKIQNCYEKKCLLINGICLTKRQKTPSTCFCYLFIFKKSLSFFF